MRHSLLDSTTSRCVWELTDGGIVHAMHQSREPDAKRWIFTILDSVPHNQFIWLPVTLWVIWHARPKEIHEAVFQSLRGTHELIERFITEINAIKHAQTGTRQVTTKVMASPTWKWYHELGYSEVTDVY